MRFALLALLVAGSLSACTGQVRSNAEQMSAVGANGTVHVTGGEGDHNRMPARELDMAAEETISNGCLHAWRTALAGNEKAAMAELQDLNNKFPQIKTTELMMGQVLEHSGKTKQAIEHYRKAVVGNEFSTMHRIKLAQAYRKDKQYDKAAEMYDQVLKGAPTDDPMWDALRKEMNECKAKSKAKS
jgi:predicted Zn-dependent protease